MDRDFSLQIQTSLIEGSGQLDWLRGDALGFSTQLWISPSDQVEVRIRNPLESPPVRAVLSVRTVAHDRNTLRVRCVAELAALDLQERVRLRAWIDHATASGAQQAGADPIFARSVDGRRLMVTWRSQAALKRSWDQGLNAGRVRLPFRPARSAGVPFLIQLPDEHRIQLSAQIVEERGEIWAHCRAARYIRDTIRDSVVGAPTAPPLSSEADRDRSTS